jgi:hypothetical protein
MICKNFNQSRKSQITIFVIIVLIIIVAIALIFILLRNKQAAVSAEQGVEIYKGCVGDVVKNAEARLIENNFYPEISDNYFVYQGKKARYLCKASMFYTPCINQEPMLIEHLRLEILNATKKAEKKCYEELKKNFRRKGYDIKDSEKNISFEIDFEKNFINAEIKRAVSVEKNEEARSYAGFEVSVNSVLYNLADLTRIILNYESTLCEFNNINWMRNFPEIKIDKFVSGEQTKVYTLSDRRTGKQISFAVKTCVLPAGL